MVLSRTGVEVPNGALVIPVPLALAAATAAMYVEMDMVEDQDFYLVRPRARHVRRWHMRMLTGQNFANVHQSLITGRAHCSNALCR